MSKRSIALLATVAAAASAAPATADAEQPSVLRGAPRMYLVDQHHVRVLFTSSTPLTARDPRVVLAGRGTAIERDIRLRDTLDGGFRYTATVRLRRDVVAGRRYLVRFGLFAERTIERRIVLRRP